MAIFRRNMQLTVNRIPLEVNKVYWAVVLSVDS